jgi:prepilin-type N-terminal cleavage/methylation domain-containing protein
MGGMLLGRRGALWRTSPHCGYNCPWMAPPFLLFWAPPTLACAEERDEGRIWNASVPNGTLFYSLFLFPAEGSAMSATHARTPALEAAFVQPTARRRGFTLVELLVVIAIIGVLIALLLPAVQAAREAARRNQCLSNLKQLSLGLLNYESAQKRFPSAFEFRRGDDPATLTHMGPNWAILILPYVEQAPLYGRIDRTVTVSGKNQPLISDPKNAHIRETQVETFRCPTDTFNTSPLEIGPARWARGNYAANAGNGALLTGLGFDDPRVGIGIYGADSPGWQDGRIRGVIGPNVAASLKEVTDGTSQTILLGEVRAGITPTDRRGTWALGQAGASVLFWYGSLGGDCNGPNVCNRYADDVAGLAPKDDALMAQECMPDFTGDELNNQATTRSSHIGGVNLGMADGSAHFVSNEIDVTPPNNPPIIVKTRRWGSTWDKLISSADDESITDIPF